MDPFTIMTAASAVQGVGGSSGGDSNGQTSAVAPTPGLVGGLVGGIKSIFQGSTPEFQKRQAIRDKFYTIWQSPGVGQHWNFRGPYDPPGKQLDSLARATTERDFLQESYPTMSQIIGGKPIMPIKDLTDAIPILNKRIEALAKTQGVKLMTDGAGNVRAAVSSSGKPLQEGAPKLATAGIVGGIILILVVAGAIFYKSRK